MLFRFTAFVVLVLSKILEKIGAPDRTRAATPAIGRGIVHPQ